MSSKRRHEGYLLVDQRESPGVPQEVLASTGGRFHPMGTGGETFESATVTCAHCNVIVILNPNRTRERGYCYKCDQYVCDLPGCNSECRSFIKSLDVLKEQAGRNLNLKEL
jgi:hypothetical protein